MIENLLEILPQLSLAMAAAIFLIILAVYFPVLGLTVSLFLYTGPTFGLLPRLDGRPALVLVVVALLLSARRPEMLNYSASVGLDRIARAVALVIISGAISLLWTVQIIQSSTGLAALGLLAVALVCLTRRLTSDQILNAVIITTSVIVIPSITLGLIGLPGTWRAGRLAGILFNPNALAIYALFLGVGVLFLSRVWIKLTLLIFAISTIILTASRGAGVSLIVAFVVYLWFRYRSKIQRMVHISTSVLLIWLVLNIDYFADRSDDPTSIFRTNNSRENFNEIAISAIEASWPLGTGIGTASEAAVNIIFKVLAEMGPFGALILVTLVAMLLKSVWGSPQGISVLAAGCVGNIFEGWLISAGNTFTILFFLLLSVAVMKKQQLTYKQESEMNVTQ